MDAAVVAATAGDRRVGWAYCWGAGGHLSNTTCAIFGTIPGESLVQALDLQGVSVSSGAACASGSLEPSPVLLAMNEAFPQGGLRFSLGWNTTEAHIDAAVASLTRALASLQDLDDDW